MINFDWEWISTVNAWQTVATISIFIVAVFVVTRFLMKFWPWLRKAIALFDALGQLPQFISRTDDAIKDIRHEVKYNNGSSLKDAVRDVKTGVDDLHTKVDDQRIRLEAADAKLRQEIEDTRPVIQKPKRAPARKKVQE